MIRIDEIVAGRLWLLPLVQGTACLAVGLALSYAPRRRPARAHQLLLTALLAAVVMPALYLAVGRLGLGILAPAAPVMPTMADTLVPGILLDAPASDDRPIVEAVQEPGPWPVNQVGPVVSPSRTAALRVPWNTIVVVCWSVATALLLVRLIVRFLLGWRVVHTAQPLDSEPIRRAVDTAKGRLGVNQSIRIRRSGSVRSPVIWCWGREPVLLVQENASDAENRADWTGVFCHEVSHWRRLDHLTGLFMEILRATFPWHPLLWWAKDRLLRLSEQACDDWVLATGQNDADYAEMLLSLAAERQMAFLPTVIGKEKTMHTRIRRIIQDNGSNPRLGARWALTVSVLALCMTVGVAVAQRRPAEPEPRDAPPTKVFQERREIEAREAAEADQQRIAMKRVLERLLKQADEKKEMLAKGNDLPEEERLAQQIELKLLAEQIEQMKSRLEILGREPAQPRQSPEMERKEPDAEARPDPLLMKYYELAQQARKMEQELEGLGEDQDREAAELKLRLKETRKTMAALENKLVERNRAEAAVEQVQAEQEAEQGRRRAMQTYLEDERRQRTEAKLEEQLRIQRDRLQQQLQERKERGEGDGPESRKMAELLRAVDERLRARDQMRAWQEVEVARESAKAPQRTRRVPAGTDGKVRLEARVYVVEHISPDRLRAILEALIEEPETVTLYANGRKATVVATNENHQRIERIIRIIDVPEEEYMAGVGQDGGREARLITLRHFSPRRMQNLLRAVLGQAGEVNLAGGERTLFVTTSSVNMKRVESIVQELDIPANDRVSATEVEELRSQMRRLSEQMQQIQKRLDQMAEHDSAGKTDDPAAPTQEYKIRY